MEFEDTGIEGILVVGEDGALDWLEWGMFYHHEDILRLLRTVIAVVSGRVGRFIGGAFNRHTERMRIFYDKGIKHEERHTKQQMVFGVLQPVLYVLCSVFIYFFLPNQHPYYSNLFEIDARKAAGQMVLVPKEYWDSTNRWIWW